MGSQFAPALCGLVAAFQEYCFFKAFQLHNSRYVDNRNHGALSRLETTPTMGHLYST